MAVLDFDKLLAPITEESPCGIDLRLDHSPSSLYYEIKDARNLARTYERRSIQEEATNSNAAPVWKKVLSLSQEILTSKSKDLEVCTWLIEALLRERQFAGLKDGFFLTAQLCKIYWDNLYPQPQAGEEGFLTRLASLTGLNGEETEGTLISAIYNVPLTASKKLGSFVLWQYQQAKVISQISDLEKRAKRLEEGNIELSLIEAAIADTPVEFFKALISDLEDCLVEQQNLSLILDERCGNAAPPSSRIREALTQYLEVIKFMTRNIIVDSTVATLNNGATEQSFNNVPSKVSDRESAFKALVGIADFFLATEPHSPLSYLIRKVVRWGKLPLPVLLDEMIGDQRVREQAFLLAGIEEEGKR